MFTPPTAPSPSIKHARTYGQRSGGQLKYNGDIKEEHNWGRRQLEINCYEQSQLIRKVPEDITGMQIK